MTDSKELFKAAVVSMIAKRRCSRLAVSDTTLLVFHEDGTVVATTSTIQLYPTPLSRKASREKAIRECRQLYPLGEGWTDHQVSIARFDPDDVARQYEEARR